MLHILSALVLLLGSPFAQGTQTILPLDAGAYRKKPSEGLALAEELISQAIADKQDALSLAELRFQGALIARYTFDYGRSADWLQSIVARSEELLPEARGRQLFRDSVNLLRHALFQLSKDSDAHAITLTALEQVAASTALSKHQRADLLGGIRLSASDHGIGIRDFETSLAWVEPIFHDSELLLGTPAGASTLAWAARQRALFQFELGAQGVAFDGLDRVSLRLERAAPRLGDERHILVALLRTRELMLAKRSEIPDRVAKGIQHAEQLITKLESTRGEARPIALRSACNVVRTIAQALTDQELEGKVACLDRVLGWCSAEPQLLDPAFRALPSTIDIARSIGAAVSPESIDQTKGVAQGITKLLDRAGSEYGEESVANLRSDLTGALWTRDHLRTQLGLVGHPAPPLATEAIIHRGKAERKSLTWTDFRGKVVLLEFWNVHCGPCIEAFPRLAALEAEHQSKGFIVLGQTSFYKLRWDERSKAAIEDSTTTEIQELEMLVRFAEHRKAQHRFLVTSDRALDNRYGVMANPTTLLVDRKGIVRFVMTGDELDSPEFSEMLESLIEE